MHDHLLFLGDIKGTKGSLEILDSAGRETLTRRIEHFQTAFCRSFLEYSDRSRSLHAATFSDSVIAYWLDLVEGQRLAAGFVTSLWNAVDSSLVRFRGFLDAGQFVSETSALSQAVSTACNRFVRVLPTSVAVWSVTVAESSHFPDGVYVRREIAASLHAAKYRQEVFRAGPFEYLKMNMSELQGQARR